MPDSIDVMRSHPRDLRGELKLHFRGSAALLRKGGVVVDGVRQGPEVVERWAAYLERLAGTVDAVERATIYRLQEACERNLAIENRFWHAARTLDPDAPDAPMTAQAFIGSFRY